MSLLTIITNVANECGYSVEANPLTSSEVTTKQLVTIAQRVNKEVALKHPWRKMFASGAITLVADQASYALPAAFSWSAYDSFWNQSTRWRVLGPVSEQEYAQIRGFNVNATIYQRFQFRGASNSELLIYPTPGSQNNGQIIIFEYIADRSVRPQTWAAGVPYNAGAYTFYNGNYYQTELGGTTGANAPVHTSGSASDGNVVWTYFSGPYNQFLAETDVSIFNEKTIELGVLERFAELHGLDKIQPRFDQAVEDDFSRDVVGKTVYAGGFATNAFFARNSVVVFGTWI